ncbi:MDR family MFS transporter [Paenibacillus tarimensis]|uniref:MDR family MFS transporter n=1 Tax=Paenibacillus tarimensis TaxID=416012 RepID=UPI001F43C1ED|nr:MDR family MFS transporter [Paenibacillus tarimensis]MCF2943282.1 MFS transporter [Paenibacillus tarimensis]
MDAVQRKITVALLISTFLAAIEVTIISTAMPQIAASLGGLEHMSWVFAAYLLTTAVSTPIWGKLADLVGRRNIYITGVIIFLVGSLMCGFANSMGVLIVFRAVQGIGAGAINPVTFTIIADAFNFEQRARVQGLVSSMWGIAGIFGPLVGGFFVDYLTWHWVFFINIPFGLISMWMIGRHFKETLEKRKRKIDYGGALTFTVGMTALLYALLSFSQEEGEGIAVSEELLVSLFAIAIVFLGLFFIIQFKHEEPMMPLRLFGIRDVAVANTASFLTSSILIGLTAYLPLWTQNVLQMGATASGLTLIPLCVGWPLGAMMCGPLIAKLGTKGVAILGASFIAGGSLALTTITTTTPAWLLVLIISVIGLGFGTAWTVYTLVIQSSVAVNMRGVAGSSNTLLRTLGQTIGVAILGAVMNMYVATDGGHNGESLAAGLHAVFAISAGIGVVSFLVTLWIPKRHKEYYQQRGQ